MENSIERQIALKAPLSRVWRALTDYQEFSEWFRVKLEKPFMPGEATGGPILHPGFEHMRLELLVKEIRPEHFFSYTWHPYPIDPLIDYSQETPTLVEFSLKEIAQGTFLVVKESGFENIPASRRLEAFRMNSQGWTQQMKNIETYVTTT